jgi:hypothetical protein
MHKGAPILRSALTGRLLLELTYRDLSVQERTYEHREEQAQRNVELLTAADYGTSESL